MTQDTRPPEAAMPFVALCRPLAVTAPLAWLGKGWHDMWAAPRQSLTYGSIVVLLSFVISLNPARGPLLSNLRSL